MFVIKMPICGIMELAKKPPSEREGDRDSGGRSLRDFSFALTSLQRALPQSASLTAPSRREPMVECNLRGMGFARCLCNTKAKLAINNRI